MARGANKSFLADPEAFLQNNVIMVSEGLMGEYTGATMVNLYQQDMDEVVDHHNVRLTVYKPRVANVGDPGRSTSRYSHQFQAFYLPWQPDRHFVIDLDDQANILFTPGLTGCTFAAISATPGAAPQVGHFNYLRPGTDTVSKTRTRQHVTAAFGAGRPDAYLKKSMYPTPADAAQRYVFIVGFRTAAGTNRWRFLAQYLDYVGPSTTTKGRRFERRTPPATVHNGTHI